MASQVKLCISQVATRLGGLGRIQEEALTSMHLAIYKNAMLELIEASE
jgi:hypothetical protein